MATPGTAQLAAGEISSGLSESEQVREYEKILRISDEIFSGAHPRLKVPQQFVRKTTSRNAPNPPTPTRQAQVKTAGGRVSSQGKPFQPKPATIGAASTQTTKPNGPSGPIASPASSRIVPKPTSEIDPIFLTKSDDLVRAELQLQRQRVERALREQLEHKKQESRQRVAMQDAKPDFDVSDVLNRAFELVPPSPSIDGPGPNGMEAPSDSYDESFDSSRAADSPVQQKPASAPRSNAEDSAAEAPVETYSDELQRLEALNKSGSDQEMRDTYPVAEPRMSDRQRQTQPAPVDLANDDTQAAQAQADAFEEPEYSPPAPGVPPMERGENREIPPEHPNRDRHRGPEYQPASRPSLQHHRRRSISPRDDVRVVRNHITSPAAPQPSRVSPLAIAKVSSVHPPKRSRIVYSSDRLQPARQDIRGSSPDVPAQQLMPRKRRRLHEDRSRPRPGSYRTQAGGSSEAFIKEEPVSPPPFADTPPTVAPQERPIYIDISSPRYTPMYERVEPMAAPAYEIDPYHEPHLEAGLPRTTSRLSVRRPLRDNQDLRRVASLHQVRQPEYTREYIERPSSRSYRAASYAVLERPPPERVRYYDEVSPSYARHYVSAGESPTSPRYQETYIDTGAMAPPPRRILIDEHGNHYREKTPPPRMQVMPPPSRISRGDVYEDGPQVRPAASVRAISVVDDPYGGRRYVQEMPPPPPAGYRRVTDYPHPIASERRTFATPLIEDREPYPRSSSVQVAGYPAARATYLEEADLPRERIIRMPSVRPPAGRYEEPREMLPRIGSVRPAERDVSVYVDDDARRPREYIERPVYVAPRPLTREERYYDGEPERVVLDGREAVHRVPPRY